MEERTYIMYLEDILLAMNRISEYIEGSDFQTFKRDYKTVDAVIRNFEIIGEASRSLPTRIKEKYPKLPWSEMYLLRNKVSHEYFGVDNEIIPIRYLYQSNKLYCNSYSIGIIPNHYRLKHIE